MPEVPEEKQNKKAPCRWRLNKRFQYECTFCHSMDEKAPCPHKEDEDDDDKYYHIGGGL